MMRDPRPGDMFEGQYPTVQIYTVYSVQDGQVYFEDMPDPIPLRSWPHFVYDRCGMIYLGKENIYTGTIQNLLQLEDDEFEILGLYEHSLCFATKDFFIKMSSPGKRTIEESLTRLRDEWNLINDLTEAGVGGLLPCSWHQIGEKGFLVKPRACLKPLTNRQQQLADFIQAGLRDEGYDTTKLKFGTWNTVPFVLNASSLLSDIPQVDK